MTIGFLIDFGYQALRGSLVPLGIGSLAVPPSNPFRFGQAQRVSEGFLNWL